MPHKELLSSLVQLLMQLVGTPAALEMASQVPYLVVDCDGNVLDYDQKEPRGAARQLIAHYEATISEIADVGPMASCRDEPSSA